MNTEMMTRVADAIEASGRFNLSFFATTDGESGDATLSADALLHNCKTTGCVAGWTNALNNIDTGDVYVALHDTDAARQALGISDVQATNLFFAKNGSVWVDCADEFGWRTNQWGDVEYWGEISASQAVIVLRRIISGNLVLAGE